MAINELKIIKREPTTNVEGCGNINIGPRELYLARRHALLIELAALDKHLGLKRKCKHCGNEQ